MLPGYQLPAGRKAQRNRAPARVTQLASLSCSTDFELLPRRLSPRFLWISALARGSSETQHGGSERSNLKEGARSHGVSPAPGSGHLMTFLLGGGPRHCEPVRRGPLVCGVGRGPTLTQTPVRWGIKTEDGGDITPDLAEGEWSPRRTGTGAASSLRLCAGRRHGASGLALCECQG